MKMLWTGIRSIINVNNTKLNNISQVFQAGKTINDPGEIAKSFNHYFVKLQAIWIMKSFEQKKSPLIILVIETMYLSLFRVPPTKSKLRILIIPTANWEVSWTCQYFY